MPLYKDQLDREIEIVEKPKRIISLVPSQTELLLDLGLASTLVGVTKYCIHPKEKVKKIKKIGGTKDFDIEKITELQPNLIIANKEENYKEGIEALQKKFPVWVSDIHDLDSALHMILEVSKIVGKFSEGENLVKKLIFDFNALKNTDSKCYKTLYFIWKEPFMVAGQDTFIDDMLKRSNLENCIKTNRYPILDTEKIKQLNPELVLLSSEPYPFKEQHIKEFSQILPNACIKIVDGELFSWYGSRLQHTVNYFKDIQKEIKLYFDKSKLN